MNGIDFTQLGGMWTYQDTLKFMQDTFTPLIQAITSALGDRVIISGCVVNESQVSPGWLIYNGELLPLAQSALATNVDVQEVNSNEQFEDATQKSVYKVRKAILTNASIGVPFSTFKQLKYLSSFLSLPTVAGSDYSQSNDNVLATITGLFNLKAELTDLQKQFNRIIVQWSGAVSNIPLGWQLCDGTNGSPDLRGKFVLGAGNGYGVGDVGGEEKHRLTIEEMPAHSHDYTGTQPINADGNDVAHGASAAAKQTSSVGGDVPHNNMPPYYTLAFIYKIPIN